MNVTKNLIFWAALFFMAIPLSGNANPDFNKDGAVRDPTSQSGWALPALDPVTSGHDNCLRCHQPGGGSAADVSGYLKGGHKNMARPADGNAWGMPGVDATHPASSWLADAGLDPLTGLFEKLGIQENYPRMFVNWSPRTISLAYCAKSDGTIGSDDVPDLIACPTCQSPIMENGTAGYPLNYPDQTTCETAQGDYIWVDAGPQPLYWIYGGAGLRRGPAVFERGSQVYSCARCHTTGWTANDINTDPDLDPDRAFDPNKLPYGNPAWSLVTFTTMTTLGNPSQLLLDPGMPLYPADGTTAPDTARNLSSWDQWGIECSRCHMSFYDGHKTWPSPSSANNGAFITTGGDITALCMNCHRQENTATGQNGVPLMLKNGSSTSDLGSKLLYTNKATQPDGFWHHADGNEFLNSPHAKFKGNWGQIGCPPYSIVPGDPSFPGAPPRVNSPVVPTGDQCSRAIMNFNGTTTSSLYLSKFARAVVVDLGQNTSTAGGCTSCHDVHETINENSSGWSTGAFKATCTDCHSNPAATITVSQVNLSLMYHPTGPGTPMENPAKACSICHQPEGMKHLWRINTDPNYITFPSYTNSESLASTAVDTTGYNAVWVDLDHACGQCHGGGVQATDHTTTGTIVTSPTGSKTLTVANATGFAAGKKIHIAGAGIGGGPFKTIISSVSGSTVTLSYAAVSSVADAAVTVSGNPAAEGAPYLTRTQSAESAKTIHDGNVNSMTCSVCHTIGAGHHDLGTTECLTCHTARLHTLVLPPTGNPTYNSSTGVTPGTGCLGCHGPGGLATHNTITADGADDNHHSNAGSCTTCHGASGGEAPNNAGKTLAADGNAFCLTCHGNSGSYPVHHGVAALATAGKSCTVCHAATAGPGQAGVPLNPLPMTNANCLGCHSSAIGTAPAIVLGTNHHGGVNCAVCHLAEPFAVMPSSGNPEYNSSTGLVTPGTGCLGCHGPGGLATHNTITADGADDNHHSNAGSCTSCHGAYGGEAPNNAGKSLAADGNAFCLTCHSTTGSYPVHHGVAAVATAGKDCTDCHKTLLAGPGQAGVPGNPLEATNANCLLCHSSAIGTAIAIIPGTNHHGAGLQNCTTCHGASGGEAPNNAGKSLAADGNAFCLTCHSNTGTDAAHHAVAAIATAGKDCMSMGCHAGNAGAPALPKTNANCLLCHSSAIGAAPAIFPGTNHHSAADCTACHLAEPFAVLPPSGNPEYNATTGLVTPGTGCLGCHGPGGLATHNTITADGADDNHHSNQGTCTTCHGAYGGAAPNNAGKSLAADGNAFCLTCHTTSGTNAGHHAVAAVATAGKNCMDCHAANAGAPGNPLAATNANCLLCHSSAIGTAPAIVPGVNHHGTGSQTCIMCHGTEPFVHPDTSMVCTECHTDKSMATLNHVDGPYTCTSCHPIGVKPVTAEQFCALCHTLDAFGVGRVVARFEQTIHTPIKTANFSVNYSTTVPKLVTFTTITTGGCTTPATWNFGDGSSIAIVSELSTAHTYSSTVTAVGVTMTCSDLTTSVTKTVYPRAISGLISGGSGSVSSLPTVTTNMGVVATAGTYTVTFTDSTGYGVYSGGTGSVRIAWGDGKTETYAKDSGPWTHMYPRARKYNIGAVVTLKPYAGYAGQIVKSPKLPVTVQKLGIIGNITSSSTTTGVNNVSVVLSLKAYYSYGTTSGMRIVKKSITKTDGAYTFQDVLPISALQKIRGFGGATEYQIEARKVYGRTRELYTFEWGIGSGASSMPAIVSDVTGTTSVTPNINIIAP